MQRFERFIQQRKLIEQSIPYSLRGVKSVGGVSATSSNNSSAPPGHGLDQIANCLCWDGRPLFLEHLEQLSHVGRGIHSAPNTSVQYIPHVLDWVQIGRHGGPGKNIDVAGGQELRGESCSVEPGVVLLKYSARGSHKWEDLWMQYLVDVSLCVQVSLDMHQATPSS